MLTDKLDRLLAAYEAQNRHPDLRDGASEAELDEIENALELRLPGDLRTLWSWRNGHASWGAPGHQLEFRDVSFIGTPEVLAAKKMVMIYQPEDEEWRRKTLDFSYCIPFAGVDYVKLSVSCVPQGEAPHIAEPVVETSDGACVAYQSIEAMIDTNIESVETWEWDGGLTTWLNPDERKIWRRYNPEVPSGPRF